MRPVHHIPHPPSPRVVEAIRHLPGRAGDVMQLYYRGMTDAEIAESLGVTHAAVWGLRTRALQRISRTLAALPDSPSRKGGDGPSTSRARSKRTPRPTVLTARNAVFVLANARSPA